MFCFVYHVFHCCYLCWCVLFLCQCFALLIVIVVAVVVVVVILFFIVIFSSSLYSRESWTVFLRCKFLTCFRCFCTLYIFPLGEKLTLTIDWYCSESLIYSASVSKSKLDVSCILFSITKSIYCLIHCLCQKFTKCISCVIDGRINNDDKNKTVSSISNIAEFVHNFFVILPNQINKYTFLINSCIYSIRLVCVAHLFYKWLITSCSVISRIVCWWMIHTVWILFSVSNYYEWLWVIKINKHVCL